MAQTRVTSILLVGFFTSSAACDSMRTAVALNAVALEQKAFVARAEVGREQVK